MSLSDSAAAWARGEGAVVFGKGEPAQEQSAAGSVLLSSSMCSPPRRKYLGLGLGLGVRVQG